MPFGRQSAGFAMRKEPRLVPTLSDSAAAGAFAREQREEFSRQRALEAVHGVDADHHDAGDVEGGVAVLDRVRYTRPPIGGGGDDAGILGLALLIDAGNRRLGTALVFAQQGHEALDL